MTVTIPLCEQHEGYYSTTVTISDNCPVCGGPRGKVYKGLSFDGSRRLEVDCWQNPCGHIDKYRDVRKEAALLKQQETHESNQEVPDQLD